MQQISASLWLNFRPFFRSRASYLQQRFPSIDEDMVIPFGDYLPSSHRHARTSRLSTPPPSSTNSPPRSLSRSFSSTSSSPSISFVLRSSGDIVGSTTPGAAASVFPRSNNYLVDSAMEETVLDAAVLKRKIYVSEAPTLKKRVRHM